MTSPEIPERLSLGTGVQATDFASESGLAENLEMLHVRNQWLYSVRCVKIFVSTSHAAEVIVGEAEFTSTRDGSVDMIAAEAPLADVNGIRIDIDVDQVETPLGVASEKSIIAPDSAQ